MSYNNINIDICENGYTVKVPSTGETFVFTSGKQLRKWIEENVSETGQVKDFCDGLDTGTTADDSDYIWSDGIIHKQLEYLANTSLT